MERAFLAAILFVAAAADGGEPPLPAFPGAEGYGAASVGGRGGKVIKVTNLNPSGPGSLQAACEAEGSRIVVFEVGGVIRGTVYIKAANITIAGQTAPPPGLTIEGMLKNPYRIKPSLHDVTIRFIRVRPRPTRRKTATADCFQLTDIDRLILDHCSCSWGSDENVDLCNSRDLTVQWCAIEESDTRGHVKGRHNFAMIMGYEGRNATVHHNLFAHHSKRAPLCGLETLDHRNNVIYNMLLPFLWHPLRMNRQRPNQPFKANLVGNYLKLGPNTEGRSSITTLDRLMWKPQWVHLYAQGNYLAWRRRVAEAEKAVKAEKPWPAPPVATHEAQEAYKLVLAHAGCLPRDPLGKRTIEEVKNGTGAWGRREPKPSPADLPGDGPSGPPSDSDGDGMPDHWEKDHKLNPHDPSDANKRVPEGASPRDRHAGYTHIEFYINELADQRVADALARAEGGGRGRDR